MLRNLADGSFSATGCARIGVGDAESGRNKSCPFEDFHDLNARGQVQSDGGGGQRGQRAGRGQQLQPGLRGWGARPQQLRILAGEIAAGKMIQDEEQNEKKKQWLLMLLCNMTFILKSQSSSFSKY